MWYVLKIGWVIYNVYEYPIDILSSNLLTCFSEIGKVEFECKFIVEIKLNRCFSLSQRPNILCSVVTDSDGSLFSEAKMPRNQPKRVYPIYKFAI